MRLFVAFELPEAVRQALAAWVAGQRNRSPSARWVRPQLMHLTLRFIGEAEPSCLPRLEEALEGAFADAPPIAMRLTDVGSFPAGTRPARVLWVGVDADPDLMGVQAMVGRAVSNALPSVEDHHGGYLPHITLARCKPAWPATAVTRLHASGRVLPSAPFRLAEGTLFASELRPRGPLHTVVATFPLQGSA